VGHIALKGDELGMKWKEAVVVYSKVKEIAGGTEAKYENTQ
jgi:hypothetical protein